MSTTNNRLKIAQSILNFEARRDNLGRLKVYYLPANDGGGKYEVAGINEHYHSHTAAVLRNLIEAGKFDEAETAAMEHIAAYTDVAIQWTTHTAVESYLRDCIFNRGPVGAAKIYQIALGVKVDGSIGPITIGEAAKEKSIDLLLQLRAARERYEREWVKRDKTSIFWKGLVNRWDKALAFAEGFLDGTDIAPSVQPNLIVPSSHGFPIEVARVAMEQYEKFHMYGEGDTHLGAQIRNYWENIGFEFPGVATAWSAVFVSWVMLKAGASAVEFKFSNAHSRFVHWAIKNKESGTGLFFGHHIDRHTVKVGDIIHNNRNHQKLTYDFASAHEAYESHSAIVVELGSDTKGKYAITIGGNEGDSVGKKRVALNANGMVLQRETNSYICVIENRKP